MNHNSLTHCRNVIVFAAGMLVCTASLLQAQRSKSGDLTALLNTSDVRIKVSAGSYAPRLESMTGQAANVWRNSCEEPLPASIEIQGTQIPLTWHLTPQLTTIDTHHVEFVYESSEPHLLLRWRWEARANFGPIEHHTTLENLSEQEIWLPLVDSFRLDWQQGTDKDLRHFYVEKGADTPSAHGTHLESVADGYRWMGRSTTYAHPVEGEDREIIPIEFIYEASKPKTGWYAGIEFSGRTRITLERNGSSLKSTLGLNPELGPFHTRIEPKGSFETPAIFLGAFTDGPDGAGNQLRPWVRAVLNNPLTWKDPQYPLTVNNSWGSGMEVTEPIALRMIAESKELGLEMFHLDAGWFRGVGDWYPDPKKFPRGLVAIADAAHKQGLRFGIWVDSTQAGVDTTPGALNVRDPKASDWLVNDLAADWKPGEFKGQTIDIGVPAARDYAAKETQRIVEDYHLDMLEHDGYLVAESCTRKDHPHAPADNTPHMTHDGGFDFALGANSTDVSYHAVRAYYAIYEQLRREHPGLLFEICNDGGRMVDFGSVAHGDYFSVTDTYDPLSNRRAFYDTSYAMPPAMLESYVGKWSTPTLENFRYMLRSGMMGWMSIMLDTTTWSQEQHDVAKHAFALYKQELRPLIRDAQLYHVSARPDGVHWDAIEYWDLIRKKGVLFAFRGTVPNEAEHHFLLSGLNAEQRYHLHFEDGSVPDREAVGSELIRSGLTVYLQKPLSSELVFIEALITKK
jgi:hypothetical protein